MLNKEILSLLQDILTDIEGSLSKIDEKTDIIFNKLLKVFTKNLLDLKDELKFLENYIKQSKKIALNWDFEERELYNLDEVMQYLQEKYKEKFIALSNIQGCLYRKIIKEGNNEYIYLLHFFVQDENGKKTILIDDEMPFKLVKALRLADDLEQTFGDKDLIIFT